MGQRGGQLAHDAHTVHVRKIRLHLLQSCLCLCAILDVREENVPPDNTAGIIADWDKAGVKPTKFAVDALQPCFVMEGNTGSDRPRKNFDNTGKIFRMYDINS